MADKDVQDTTAEDTNQIDADLELEKSDTDGVVGGMMMEM